MFSRTVRRSQSGFSLAEVMVATAIFAVIFIAALLVYDRSNKVFKSGVEAADMQQNTRVAFDKLVADVRLAGFDFDRDGVPTSAGENQSPDEQLEYAGAHALTLRSNFDYMSSTSGRTAALEIPNSNFPIVTTANDEIVTYALVPDTAGATTESMTFYADVTDGTVPKRQSFPGGSAEDTVTISGVDLCASGCTQPPYTLYRFTVDDKGGVTRTPLASNIRNLTFDYFSDSTGSTALAITDAGGGKYDPGTAGSMSGAERTKRAEIKAIRVTLVGMNEANDSGWTQPGETVTSVQKKRQYQLTSMIIPRNLGKRGMREQSSQPPGTPKITSVCFNYCGLVQVNWEPPASGAGEIETYYVLWDTTITSPPTTTPPEKSQPAGLANTLMLGGLNPDTVYRFGIAATNSYGVAYGTTFVEGAPLNGTTPEVAPLTSVTGTPSAEKNAINLTWTLPTANISGANTATCKTPLGATSPMAALPQPGEMSGVEIWRSTDPSFDPTVASPKTVKVATATASALAYSDTSAANCTPYYYRLRLVEACGSDPTKNITGVVGVSDFNPKVGTAALPGNATSTETPETPGALVIDAASSACSAGLCSVNASWPAVTSDLTGATIAVDKYTVRVKDNVNSTTTDKAIYLSAGDATLSGGAVTYKVTNLVDQTPAYDISARAEQCGFQGGFSASDKWPKCNFASGETLKITMSGVNAGAGTLASPFEVTGTETITFGVTTAQLTLVTASMYNASTGVLAAALAGSANAAGAVSLTAAWPDAADNTTFRVDYVVTDKSTPGCSRSGNFFVRDTVITCPFQTVVSPTVNLIEGNTATTHPSVSFPLKNNSAFPITFVKAEVTWKETDAHSSRDVTISPVTLPSGATTFTNLTLAPTTVNSTGTFTASTNAASQLFANDTSGNYVLKFVMTTNGNKDLEGQGISKIDIFYRLPGDSTTDPASIRVCTVFTK